MMTMTHPSARITAVDLFCGAGGLTRGLLDSGIRVAAGVDSNADCAHAYASNNAGVHFINESVTDIHAPDIQDFYQDGDLKLLCGCAPCQTFSTMNQKDEPGRRKDRRWKLLLEFSRLVRELAPDLVSMENVPGIMRTDVFADFLDALEADGYFVDYHVIDCSEYGMPQRRRRLVLVASLLGEIRIPSPRDACRARKTVRDAIGGLPALKAGETSKGDRLHAASALSEMNLERIRASKPGGTWHDWPDGLLCDCHRKAEGDGYGAVYGRMEWDEPSPTITTQFYNYGSGRFGHPDQDRALSLREGAILQGFPIDYEFDDPERSLGRRKLGMLIGNAVPVGLGELVGATMVRHAGEAGARAS